MFCKTRLAAASLFYLLQAPAGATEAIIAKGTGGVRTDPALGVGETFGRWLGPIRFVYDPDGAPARFSSQAHMAELLEEAWTQWERVSGLRFELADITSNAVDDRELPTNQQDGFVRVSWRGDLGGAAAQAGPYYDFYDRDLGYFPYFDGSVELNSSKDAIEADAEMVAVLVHEFGHLVGLGHSDNPDSVMYANPYNFLRYPREDDIRVTQTLYGEGAASVNPSEPVAEWLFVPPAEASASRTRYVFKPNQQTGDAAALAVDDVKVTSIGSGTSANAFVTLSGGIGSHQNPSNIDIDALLVLVDPSGYVHATTEWELSCAANFACERGIGIEQVRVLKTLPGTWHVYVLDMSNGAANARTLLALPLTVSGEASRNRPPEVTVKADAGTAADIVTFTLAATDPENHDMTVIWHKPGSINGGLSEALGSDGITTQTVDFGLTGEHTMFVEVRDDGERYDGSTAGTSPAGEGFQTLVRLTVKLPLGPQADAFTVVSSSNDEAEFLVSSNNTDVPLAAMLGAVKVPPLDGIITSTGAATTAGFRLGATGDGGATTAATFRTSDQLVIAGGVDFQAGDVGKPGAVFVVMRSITAAGDIWSYRDANGQFKPWNGQIGTLRPAYSNDSFPVNSVVQAYAGALPVGDHRVFIGYRLDNSAILHYTSFALRLTITN